MLRLMKKEFCLAMHPITPIMVLLSAMVLIPNYPYIVIFFYISLAIFFTCQMGRENNDVIYSMNLPINKKSIVSARFMLAIIVELAQLLLMIPLCLVSQQLTPEGNQAGMDANITLFAMGFTVYGLFNLVFFHSYYKDVNKVGKAFIKSSILIFLCAALDPVSTHIIPFVQDCLDTKDPEYLSYKLIALAVGIAIYAILTMISFNSSVKNFEMQDL